MGCVYREFLAKEDREGGSCILQWPFVIPEGSRPPTLPLSPSHGNHVAHSVPCVCFELKWGHETVQAHQLGKL